MGASSLCTPVGLGNDSTMIGLPCSTPGGSLGGSASVERSDSKKESTRLTTLTTMALEPPSPSRRIMLTVFPSGRWEGPPQCTPQVHDLESTESFRPRGADSP